MRLPITLVASTLALGLDEAAAKGWTVVDMKSDWNTVFAFQKAK